MSSKTPNVAMFTGIALQGKHTAQNIMNEHFAEMSHRIIVGVRPRKKQPKPSVRYELTIVERVFRYGCEARSFSEATSTL